MVISVVARHGTQITQFFALENNVYYHRISMSIYLMITKGNHSKESGHLEKME